MITPTIGRVVWFYPGPGFPGSRLSEQPMDAHVAYVWGERAVNLMVVDHRGCPWPVASVPLRQEGDPEPAGHWCEWMPYQVGQANKNEGVTTGTADTKPRIYPAGCTELLRAAGKPCPRTCRECGLGPCQGKPV